MDLDDIDIPAAPSKTSKFAPKSKIQPKSKLKQPKVEPPPTVIPAVPAVVVKEEEPHPVSSATGEVANGGDGGEVKEEEEAPANGDLMEEDDYVVDEYDVYYTPRNVENQLYVLQYPLRPSWRPYEMEQKCTEVRVKPKSGQVELDLSIDMDTDNYDPDAFSAQKMQKLTLSSMWKSPHATGYAVGVLMGKKLYLNPVHAVLQLRPSMGFLDSGGSKKRNAPDTTVKAEGSSNVSAAGSSKKQSQQMETKEVEPWIPLKYHSSSSVLSEGYLRKLMTEENNSLEFSIKPCDYLNSLCPGTVIDRSKLRGPSRRAMLNLPLEERLKRWLAEGPPIQRFSSLKHLAPDDTDEVVLQILQRFARLVQGLWVPGSLIRHPTATSSEQLVRDYTLTLFSHSPFVKDSEFGVLGSRRNVGKALIREIAVERPAFKDWKFKVPTDNSFIKHYPDVVEQQRKLLQEREKYILESLNKDRRPGASSRPERSGKHESPIHSSEGTAKATNATNTTRMSMSKETREALPNVLRKFFETHKVCSFQTIRQGLREMAVSVSTLPKADSRAIKAAAYSVDGPQEELQAVISEVAININGVYILKSSEHPELNPLRNVVIEMFLGSGPNTKLKKGEIFEASKIKLNKEPTPNEFQKVINEICVSKSGGWVLKNGDRDPKS